MTLSSMVVSRDWQEVSVLECILGGLHMDVAFEKPISVEQAVRTLSAARSLILDGRLRYHRAGLEVPVSLSCKGQKPVDAFLINVSQGGMQIHTKNPVEPVKSLQVSFD